MAPQPGGFGAAYLASPRRRRKSSNRKNALIGDARSIDEERSQTNFGAAPKSRCDGNRGPSSILQVQVGDRCGARIAR